MVVRVLRRAGGAGMQVLFERRIKSVRASTPLHSWKVQRTWRCPCVQLAAKSGKVDVLSRRATSATRSNMGSGGWRLEFVRGASVVFQSPTFLSPQFKSIMPIVRQIVLDGVKPVARVFSFQPPWTKRFVFGLG